MWCLYHKITNDVLTPPPSPPQMLAHHRIIPRVSLGFPNGSLVAICLLGGRRQGGVTFLAGKNIRPKLLTVVDLTCLLKFKKKHCILTPTIPATSFLNCSLFLFSETSFPSKHKASKVCKQHFTLSVMNEGNHNIKRKASFYILDVKNHCNCKH